MKWLALAFLPSLAFAEPQIQAQNPHEFGWWLGDELVQRIQIKLPDGVTIDPASLPKPRAVDYWLDLREVTSERTGTGVTLTLRWQNFYAAVAPDRREVPPSAIRFSDGTETQLPGFSFVTSPLRPITDRSSPDQMQPEARFHLIDPTPNRLGLAVAVLAFLAALALMARHQAWWPFHARKARPFTHAARQIARHPDPAQQRRLLHRAFDAAFGRVLIGQDIDHFLQARPEFRPLKYRVTAFFTASDGAFFGTEQIKADDVGALVRDLSRIERGRG